MEAQTTESSFETVLNTCGICKENFQGRDPKLLKCLHIFCKNCIMETAESTAEDVVRCPICKERSLVQDMVNNPFVFPVAPSSSASSQATDEAKTCTACEEGEAATSCCQECSEWLCDQCVKAHRRVRVTKDHIIVPKEKAQRLASSPAATERNLYCDIHPQDPLKVYCETCERLTCMHCQLFEHKDHQYQFIPEAAAAYRSLLQKLITRVQEKHTYLENAKGLVENRYLNIGEREKEVTKDINSFAMRLISAIEARCASLTSDVKGICSAKQSQLQDKKKEKSTDCDSA